MNLGLDPPIVLVEDRIREHRDRLAGGGRSPSGL
jgi:hypothetical protein